MNTHAYPTSLREHAIDLMVDDKLNFSEVGRRLNISWQTARKWYYDYRAAGRELELEMKLNAHT